MSKTVAILKASTLPPFCFIQRWASRFIWGAWLANFLFWELTGTLRWTPWRTLSETAWDTEEKIPGTRRYLEAFLVGLAIHIRYRTTLNSSVRWARENEKNFDAFVNFGR